MAAPDAALTSGNGHSTGNGGNGDLVGPQHTGGKNPDIDAVVEKLDGQLKNFFEDNESLRNFLHYKGAMHNYSWLNLMLILIDYQHKGLEGPVLTMGYKGWLKQGRKVKPGSKAISLFKPVLQYWRDYDNKYTNKPGAKFDPNKGWYMLRSKAVGFEIIRKTFHIQDTDGPEYEPPAPIPSDDNSDQAKTALIDLSMVATKLGISSIEYKELPDGYGGFYTPTNKSITLNNSYAVAQQAKTLAHELAHHVAHLLNLDHHDFYAKTRDAAETVVEGAAFIVSAHQGFDTSAYSVPYIATWAGDLNKVRMLLRDMSKVADVIVKELTKDADSTAENR